MISQKLISRHLHIFICIIALICLSSTTTVSTVSLPVTLAMKTNSMMTKKGGSNNRKMLFYDEVGRAKSRVTG